MAARRRSWWGWGWEDQALSDGDVEESAALLASLGIEAGQPQEAPHPDDLALPAPRVTPPDALAHLCSVTNWDRASHTHGKAFRDVVRGLRGELPHPPDVVVFPAGEQDVVDVLDWCSRAAVAAVPYGGGSSVVGGVECAVGEKYAGAVSIDLARLDRVVEVDVMSRAARIQGGTTGPGLEDQLRPHGLTLRHFPQSFEFSTLGGWLATRSAGHYATGPTHIDDFVESLRVVTPAGVAESRRVPASGAGPSPDRLFLGSEGVLGIITEAWVRVQRPPRFRASAAVHFADFADGVAATRALAQSGLYPSNCRLLDAAEAAITAGVRDGSNLLVVGFESADHPVTAEMERATELCGDHGGVIPGGVRLRDAAEDPASGQGPAERWRHSFLRAPYLRDALVRRGLVVETFETACTWDHFEELHHSVVGDVAAALAEISGGGWVTCRFTHLYPDGPAPYFTVLAPGVVGAELEIWDQVKSAAAEAILGTGGTITHHHAVGREHRPWYRRQAAEPFVAALRAAKGALDPQQVLNPGVLL